VVDTVLPLFNVAIGSPCKYELLKLKLCPAVCIPKLPITPVGEAVALPAVRPEKVSLFPEPTAILLPLTDIVDGTRFETVEAPCTSN
jgi:hypothetical protein